VSLAAARHAPHPHADPLACPDHADLPNPACGRHELRRWRLHATLRILTPTRAPDLIVMFHATPLT